MGGPCGRAFMANMTRPITPDRRLPNRFDFFLKNARSKLGFWSASMPAAPVACPNDSLTAPRRSKW